MFESLLESAAHGRKGGPARTLLASLLAHAAVVLALLVAPLIYYQSLPDTQILTFLLAAPPPLPQPPAPPPAPQENPNPNQPVRAVYTLAEFQAPTQIPEGIPEPPDSLPVWTLPGDRSAGVGPPGGPGVGLLPAEGLVVAPLEPPPPPPPTRKAPLKVFSDLQQAKLVRRVEPVYPPLAVRARIEGLVLLQATIGEEGDIRDVIVLKGHALLRQAAVDAVRQWRYSPTILNGEPVEVITTISVVFKLTR